MTSHHKKTSHTGHEGKTTRKHEGNRRTRQDARRECRDEQLRMDEGFLERGGGPGKVRRKKTRVERLQKQLRWYDRQLDRWRQRDFGWGWTSPTRSSWRARAENLRREIKRLLSKRTDV